MADHCEYLTDIIEVKYIKLYIKSYFYSLEIN
jgi:hypothetical protein